MNERTIPLRRAPGTVIVGAHVGEMPLDVSDVVWSYDATKLELLPNPVSRESVKVRALPGAQAGEIVEAVGTRPGGGELRLRFGVLM